MNSRSIEETSESARDWLREWAVALDVSRDTLRLNSWAVRGANGIDWHFDYEDVIHFQIMGDKRFKLLRSPQTRFADRQTKIFERILAAEQDFSEASDVIVREGTITVIPRGVWHWSESQSDESFAVSLCISTPSCAQVLSQALYKRLRLSEQNRTPLLGNPGTQRDLMEACAMEARALLQSINCDSVLSQECRLEIPRNSIDSSFFYIGSRANARLAPMRLLVDGKVIEIAGDENKNAVLHAICEVGHGFHLSDLRRRVPHVDAGPINDVLAWLVEVGFLDFVD